MTSSCAVRRRNLRIRYSPSHIGGIADLHAHAPAQPALFPALRAAFMEDMT